MTIEDKIVADPENRGLAVASFATVVVEAMLGREVNHIERSGIHSLANKWLKGDYKEPEEITEPAKNEKEEIDDGK